VIAKKMKHQKIGRVKEKRRAKMKFSLMVESPGKFSMRNLGNETL
jgi:hypothetical protein